MNSRAESFLSLAFLLIAAWAVFEARDWPISARLFPWLASIPLLVLSTLLLVINVLRPTNEGKEAMDFKFSENVEPAIASARALNILGWMLGFTSALFIIGFHIAIPLMVFLYTRFQGRETQRLSLSLAAGAYLFFWGVFDRLLTLPIPQARLWIWMEKFIG
jgi:hypothetical protein